MSNNTGGSDNPLPTEATAFCPWRITNLQLLEPLPVLESEPNVAGLFLVLWCGDVPLGHAWIAARSLPISPKRLIASIADVIAPALGDHLLSGFREPLPMPPLTRHRELEAPNLRDLLAVNQPLRLLARTPEATTEQPPGDRCSVSVVVCTRDRPDDLARCLASLDRLDPKPDEVLVVDNAPEGPAAREVVERHAGVIYVPEPRTGLSVARNTGIRHAAGEIIAFTDDDVEVHSNWVAALRRGFASSDVGVVTGLVLPAKLDTPAQVWFQGGEGSHGWSYRKREYDRGYLKQLRHLYVPVWDIGAGANMAFRRDAIDAVGLFDERLGPGKSGGCGEDSEIWYRMLAAGIRCLYFPEAVVHHHHRRHEGQLRSQIRSYQRGHVAALFVQFFNHRHIGNLVRVFLVLPLQFLTQAARSFVFGTTRKTFLVDQCVGYLQGLLDPLKLLSPRWRAAPSNNAGTPSKIT
jgi:GT2 family glycosyltransferase